VSGASYKSFDEAMADALRDITARFDKPRVDVDGLCGAAHGGHRVCQ
jgi:hypothetical protein